MGDVVSSFLFQPPNNPTPILCKKFFWLETKFGSKISAYYIKRPRAKYTILYSHGNAEDIGMIYHYLKDLSKLLCVNILAYDYTGYGISAVGRRASTPSEQHCYADIDAAYQYLTRIEKVASTEIIVYGRSVGSGPSCYLAERIQVESKGKDSIGGLILHSPFLSVYRIMIDLGFTVEGDIFPNINRAPQIECPVQIIHGKEDTVVPFEHGALLQAEFPEHCRTMPFWADRMGHNNIELEMPKEFLTRLRRFILHVENENRRLNDRLKETFGADTSAPEAFLNQGVSFGDEKMDAMGELQMKTIRKNKKMVFPESSTIDVARRNDYMSSPRAKARMRRLSVSEKEENKKQQRDPKESKMSSPPAKVKSRRSSAGKIGDRERGQNSQTDPKESDLLSPLIKTRMALMYDYISQQDSLSSTSGSLSDANRTDIRSQSNVRRGSRNHDEAMVQIDTYQANDVSQTPKKIEGGMISHDDNMYSSENHIERMQQGKNQRHSVPRKEAGEKWIRSQSMSGLDEKRNPSPTQTRPLRKSVTSSYHGSIASS